MSNADDTVITGMASCSPVELKDGVRFQLTYQTGAREFFFCPAELISRLLIRLSLAGERANQMRDAGNGAAIETAAPLRMTSAEKTRQFRDGSIAFKFGCDMGFPIQLSMTRDQARQTIELLQAEMDRPSAGKKHWPAARPA